MKKIILLIAGIFVSYLSFAQLLEVDWFTSYGDNATDMARNLAVDKAGNTYIIGYITKNTGDFNNPKIQTQTFLLKYDCKGILKWKKEIGGDNSNEGKAVAVDDEGNVYISGVFVSTINLDKINLIKDSEDANTYIAKYDSNGVYLWHKILRPHQEDAEEDHHHGNGHGGHKHFHPIVNQITDMKIDRNNAIYLTGYFSEGMDFDPSENEEILTAEGNMNAYIVKLDNEGQYVWAKVISSKDVSKSNALAFDSQDNVYLTGSFTKTATLGKLSLEADGGTALFIAKLNQDGKEQWMKKITNTKNNSGNYIYIDSNDCVYITGYISSRTEFDEIETVLEVYENANNLFIAKLKTDGAYEWVKAVKGKPYAAGECIATDSYGNIYVSGYFNGTIEGGEEQTVYASGKEDGFLMMLDKEGNIIYTYPIGGIDHDRASRMLIHDDNSIVLIGAHNGPFFIDPVAFTDYVDFQGTTDAFIIKFSHALSIPHVKVKEVNANSIELEWDAQSYAVGYEVILHYDKYKTTYYVGNNSMIISPLLPGKAHTIRVRAFNNSKHSKQAEVKVVTPPIANEAKGIKNNEFTASWTKTKSEKLKLFVSTKEDFSVCLPEFNGISVNKNNLKIANLQDNTTYYYRLQTATGHFSNTVSITTK